MDVTQGQVLSRYIDFEFNVDVFFPQTSYHTKTKEFSLPYYLPLETKDGFMHFQWVIEIQRDSV